MITNLNKSCRACLNLKKCKKIERARFYWLQKIDQDFMKQVKPTLHLFGKWFIVHWTLFALTTVLLTAFIVQIIIDIIQCDIESVDSLLLPYSKSET